MDSLKVALEVAGVKVGLLAGGFIGAVLSLRFVAAQTTWEKVCIVCGGTAASVFLTPIITNYINVNASTEYGISFLLGVYGMSAMSELYKFIQSGDFLRLAKKKLGAGE